MGTGPAPTGTRTGATLQPSLPTGLDATRKSPPSSTAAWTIPPAVSRANTGASAGTPGIVTLDQVVPPSWVAHRSGPKAHPLFVSAKRRPLTPEVAWPGPPAIVVGGAGAGDHVLPPSPVRAIAAHEPPAQVPVPRTHPASAETNVTDAGSRPRTAAGSTVSTGVAEGEGDGVATAAGAVEATGVAGLVAPGPSGPPGVFPPFRDRMSAETATTTTAAAASSAAKRA